MDRRDADGRDARSKHPGALGCEPNRRGDRCCRPSHHSCDCNWPNSSPLIALVSRAFAGQRANFGSPSGSPCERLQVRVEQMEKVGFIGLGRMGRGMASNLCRKGFELVVYDTNPEPMLALEELARISHAGEVHRGSE